VDRHTGGQKRHAGVIAMSQKAQTRHAGVIAVSQNGIPAHAGAIRLFVSFLSDNSHACHTAV